MARIIPDSFGSVTELKQHYGPLPRPYDWRLITPGEHGEIQGLPGSRGQAIATNGILVAIMQQTRLFIGHLDSWVKDEEQPLSVCRQVTTTTKIKRQTKVDISEFV